MGALTATKVTRESMGSLTLNIVDFASVSTAGDYYTGPTGVVFCWANGPTSTAAANGASAVWDGTNVQISVDTAGPVKLFVAFRG
jgi:hypothetical protein